MSHAKHHEYTIVTPTVEDVEPTAVMWAQSWLDTYPNDEAGVSREWVQNRVNNWLTPEGLAKRTARLEESKNNSDVLWRVAKDSLGAIVGVISPHRDEKSQRLGAIYVDKKHYGTGLAQRLMAEILAWADPNRPLELEVASYNERAKAFYRKYNFEEVKDSEHLVHETIPVVTMIRKGEKQ